MVGAQAMEKSEESEADAASETVTDTGPTVFGDAVLFTTEKLPLLQPRLAATPTEVLSRLLVAPVSCPLLLVLKDETLPSEKADPSRDTSGRAAACWLHARVTERAACWLHARVAASGRRTRGSPARGGLRGMVKSKPSKDESPPELDVILSSGSAWRGTASRSGPFTGAPARWRVSKSDEQEESER
jgi:hypothetical protein